MRLRGGARVGAAFGVVSGGLLACSAIIGTRDLTLVDADAGADAGVVQSDGAVPAKDSAIAPDAGCGANLQTSSDHCGRCGHSCLGGACNGGVCQPVAIVQGLAGPWSLAVDATNVYWGDVDSDQVMKAKKDGTGVTTLAAGAANAVSTPFDLVVDDAYVYWVNQQYASSDPPGLAARCAIAGCGGKGQILVSGLDSPTGVAVDGTNVYWMENYGDKVGRALKGDGGAAGTIVANLNYGHDVTVDNAFVYYSSDDTIGRVAKDAAASDAGGPTQVLFYKPSMYAFGLEVDNTNVYWAVGDDPGLVEFAPKTGVPDGGAPTVIAGSLHTPLNVAVDDTNIYIAEVGPNTSPDPNGALFVDSRVFMCPKTGCPVSGPILLAGGQHNVKDVVVDDVAIYWTVKGNTSNEGAIVRLAKP